MIILRIGLMLFGLWWTVGNARIIITQETNPDNYTTEGNYTFNYSHINIEKHEKRKARSSDYFYTTYYHYVVYSGEVMAELHEYQYNDKFADNESGANAFAKQNPTWEMTAYLEKKNNALLLLPAATELKSHISKVRISSYIYFTIGLIFFVVGLLWILEEDFGIRIGGKKKNSKVNNKNQKKKK